MVTVHPELIGTPGRIDLLREFLARAARPGVWRASMSQIADHWRATAAPNSPDHPVEVFERLTQPR